MKKPAFQCEVQVTVPKLAHPQAETIEGGCLLYSLPMAKEAAHGKSQVGDGEIELHCDKNMKQTRHESWACPTS
jgi:hypothetical protein